MSLMHEDGGKAKYRPQMPLPMGPWIASHYTESSCLWPRLPHISYSHDISLRSAAWGGTQRTSMTATGTPFIATAQRPVPKERISGHTHADTVGDFHSDPPPGIWKPYSEGSQQKAFGGKKHTEVASPLSKRSRCKPSTCRRRRTVFSAGQLCSLEQVFSVNQYVAGVQGKSLARELGLSERCHQYPLGSFMIMLIFVQSVAGLTRLLAPLNSICLVFVRNCCVMSGIAPSDTLPKPCLCAACVAPGYGTHAPTGQQVDSLSHFDNIKAIAAEKLMIPFNPSSVGFQPLSFPYPLGVMPPLPQSKFAANSLIGHYSRLPEENGFMDATGEFTKMQTSSKQQLPRGYWTTRARGASERPRRIRTVFSPSQLEQLEKEFKMQQYIGSAQRTFIASQLGLTETQVKVWFQNRRIRWRKQNLGSSAATEH